MPVNKTIKILKVFHERFVSEGTFQSDYTKSSGTHQIIHTEIVSSENICFLLNELTIFSNHHWNKSSTLVGTGIYSLEWKRLIFQNLILTKDHLVQVWPTKTLYFLRPYPKHTTFTTSHPHKLYGVTVKRVGNLYKLDFRKYLSHTIRYHWANKFDLKYKRYTDNLYS